MVADSASYRVGAALARSAGSAQVTSSAADTTATVPRLVGDGLVRII
jgi:hypothetical protein